MIHQRKDKMFTLLVVIEEGGDAISRNHSLFLISYIKVSPCPANIEELEEIINCRD